nr:MAG TPA: hypothetical protein [Caudoviricetes sp.]
MCIPLSSINLNYWVYRIYRLYPRVLKYIVYDFVLLIYIIYYLLLDKKIQCIGKNILILSAFPSRIHSVYKIYRFKA